MSTKAVAIADTLDPKFQPAVLANRAYRAKVKAAGTQAARLAIAIEREEGLVSRHDLDILPDAPETPRIVDRHIKFLLWSQGGLAIHVHGPKAICDRLAADYAPTGARAFDGDIMKKTYDVPLSVRVVDAESKLPAPKEMGMSIGGHLEGCRIGFDLGASDYKLAAVKDGEPVFSTEIPWNPSKQADPAYHYDRILEGLKLAASHLPRVDAIGGSSAGIWVANRVKVASLFRAVPADRFEKEVKDMFINIGKDWGVPLVVANDGDVTALAGALSLERNAMLGIAMGSSEAVGYIDPQGRITGWLNELAFAPVDFNLDTVADEWSGDIGVGALYFSQQAVNKLAPAVGFSFPDDMLLPERLKEVQAKANAGDEKALKIFTTIGVYLGYALPHYADYYDFENCLLLGRVTSGAGGEVILAQARAVLAEQFPEVNEKITIHVPDEKSRRVGQAVAAASLPEIG